MLNTNKTTRFQTVLYPGEQQIIPNFVQYLRDQGVEGIGPVGGIHAGAAFLTADSGDLSGVFVAARTSTPGDGGRYGVFYSAVPAGAASLSSTWICGLRQDENNRTNLALVSTGDADGNPDVFLIELFVGETGLKAGAAEGITVKAKGWKQIGSILTQYAPGIKQGYARVTRSSGSNPFIVYAVINDGARPGERTGDGAFIASRP